MSAQRADLIIPTSCFTEKEGIYVNLEGRPQISRQVKMPLPNIDHSWDFFIKLSKILKIDLGYKNFEELRFIMFKNHEHLSKINEIQKTKEFKSKDFKKSFIDKEIESNIKNYYMTDSVSRHSPTMANCSKSFVL